MKLSGLTLVAALASCAPSCAMGDRPPPAVHVDLSGVRAEHRVDVMAGAVQWSACGVDLVGHDADISITIREPEPGEGLGGFGVAYPDEGLIILWTGLGENTSAVAAHEVGHLIIPTSEHLDGVGVLSSPHSSLTMTQADRDFACRVGGLCCD